MTWSAAATGRIWPCGWRSRPSVRAPRSSTSARAPVGSRSRSRAPDTTWSRSTSTLSSWASSSAAPRGWRCRPSSPTPGTSTFRIGASRSASFRCRLSSCFGGEQERCAFLRPQPRHLRPDGTAGDRDRRRTSRSSSGTTATGSRFRTWSSSTARSTSVSRPPSAAGEHIRARAAPRNRSTLAEHRDRSEDQIALDLVSTGRLLKEGQTRSGFARSEREASPHARTRRQRGGDPGCLTPTMPEAPGVRPVPRSDEHLCRPRQPADAGAPLSIGAASASAYRCGDR